MQILPAQAIETIIKGVSYCKSRLASHFSIIRIYFQ